MVGLVNDDQIVGLGGDDLTMLRASRRRQRSHDQGELLPGLGPQRPKCIVRVGDKAGEAKFRGQFLAPLFHQTGRRQDEHAFDHLTHKVFLQDQTGLDRLAQADLIAQQTPTAEAAQHRACGADLVVKRLEVKRIQTDKIVEAGHQLQLIGHQLQLVGSKCIGIANRHRSENAFAARQNLNVWRDVHCGHVSNPLTGTSNYR